MVQTALPDSLYHVSRRIDRRSVLDCVTYRWVQGFMNANKIVGRAQTGKLMVSSEKQEEIEKSVAYHLGCIHRAFLNGSLKEEDVANADETHFIMNSDNGKTLGFVGDNDVKYLDVVSGGESITMMVLISGGPEARVEVPMLVFKNPSRSYPIRGIPDNIPGVCYRSSPKAWMDRPVWSEWLQEPRVMKALPNGRIRKLFVDNCSSHITDESVQAQLNAARTSLYKFPPNATDLIQPADSFVIQKIKEVWQRRWEQYKLDSIRSQLFKPGSGRIQNPGKGFFLRLAAYSVREVNNMRDKHGIRMPVRQ